MLTSKYSQSTILQALVAHQPNILCQKNKYGLIPLHIALKNSFHQLIEYLLPEKEEILISQAQQSLLILDSNERHSLHYAAHSGLTKFIEHYFSTMTKEIMNQQDLFGLTPLHYAW